jgi:hypothetical protein
MNHWISSVQPLLKAMAANPQGGIAWQVKRTRQLGRSKGVVLGKETRNKTGGPAMQTDADLIYLPAQIVKNQ